MISEKAYAKVNLSLLITGKTDNGYHLLDTVMQTVSLYDIVSIEKNSINEIKVIYDNVSISDENDICYRAVELFKRTANVTDFFTVNVNKNIPLLAGLGGGSTDAAAVLRGLNKIYGDVLNNSQLCEIGLKLGADVPFCINGGCARARGIGEKIEQINRKLPLNIVLIKDGDKDSTGQMYKEFDLKGDFSHSSSVVIDSVKALENNDFNLFIRSCYNDFTKVSNDENIRDALLCAGASAVSLSGSGPTAMGFFSSKNEADIAEKLLKDKFSFVCSVTHTE